MDKISSFFRVFDVAFFAPGALLLLIFWHASDPSELNLSIDVSTAAGVFAVTVGFTLAYILGLMCHSLQRLLYLVFGRRLSDKLTASEGRTSWYQTMEANSLNELTQYFWYMRSTCWNLATALAVGSAYAQAKGKHPIPGGWIGVAVGILLLLFAGFEFHRANKKASKASAGTASGKTIWFFAE